MIRSALDRTDNLSPGMLALDEHRPPVPPADLMLRVVPSFEVKDLPSARFSFDAEGLNNLRFFENALGAVSPWHHGGEVWLADERVSVPRTFADFERLLDFGCGCGRFVRHLRPVADQVEIHGTDIDAEMIDWLRANVPYGRFEVAPHLPPLPYPDHRFDLVLSHSVFSHLDERHQDHWLAELQRITRPGACLMLTVEGPSTWARIQQAVTNSGASAHSWEAELRSRGILFIDNDAWVGSTHPDFYHSTIHAPWYVFQHWAAFFDVEAYLVDGSWSQDLVVLRRREDGAPPTRPLIVPEPASAVPASTDGVAADAMAGLRSAAKRARRQAMDTIRARRQPNTAATAAGAQTDLADVAREISMLRVGLYEQGRRISILAEQLRDELRAARAE